MLAARTTKPKLALSISTAATQSSRPSLSLKAPLKSPLSPLPMSPTARNTKLNQRGFSTAQPASYSYANSSSSRSILKKGSSSASTSRRLQFFEESVVHCVTPIDDMSYYGEYAKMSKEERRWSRK